MVHIPTISYNADIMYITVMNALFASMLSTDTIYPSKRTGLHMFCGQDMNGLHMYIGLGSYPCDVSPQKYMKVKSVLQLKSTVLKLVRI